MFSSKHSLEFIFSILINKSNDDIELLLTDLSRNSFIKFRLTEELTSDLIFILKKYLESDRNYAIFILYIDFNKNRLNNVLHSLLHLFCIEIDSNSLKMNLKSEYDEYVYFSGIWQSSFVCFFSRTSGLDSLQSHLIDKNISESSNWGQLPIHLTWLFLKFRWLNSEYFRIDIEELYNSMRLNISHISLMTDMLYNIRKQELLSDKIIYFDGESRFEYIKNLLLKYSERDLLNMPNLIFLNVYRLLIDYYSYCYNEEKVFDILKFSEDRIVKINRSSFHSRISFSFQYAYQCIYFSKFELAIKILANIDISNMTILNMKIYYRLKLMAFLFSDKRFHVQELSNTIIGTIKPTDDILNYYLAWAHFYLNDFSTALRMAKSIETIHRDKQGFGMGIRILEILCYIESKQFDGIEYAFVNLKNQITWLKRQGKLKPRYHYLYKLLLKLHNTGYDYRKTYKMMKEKIHLMDSTDPYWRWDVRSPEAMPVQLWFLRRMTNNSKLKGVSQISPEDSK